MRRGSDIDIHLFTDDEEALEEHLHWLGWAYEVDRVAIRTPTGIRDYTHVLVVDTFPIELCVYRLYEPRVVSRSSTDGKPIRRISAWSLASLIADEHPTPWAHYLDTGLIDQDLDRFAASDAITTLAEAEMSPPDWP